MWYIKNQLLFKFIDFEFLCSYFFSFVYECKIRVKDVYEYIKYYWVDCFLEFLSYQVYNVWFNCLVSVLFYLVVYLVVCYFFVCIKGRVFFLFIDFMFIIMCSGKRVGKVVRELCDKGYNLIKKMYYFGVKLYGFGFLCFGVLFVIEFM